MTATTQNSPLRDFWFRLSKSQFFVGSLLIHLLLVLLFGTKALFDNMKEQPDMIATEAGSFVSTDPNPAPPAPPAQPQQQKPQFNVTPPQASAAPASMSAIVSTAPASSFTIPAMAMAAPNRVNTISEIETPITAVPTRTSPTAISQETKAAIAGFTGGWATSPAGGGGGSLKSRKFKFTAYVAKYAGGDWASTVRQSGGKIIAGSLPNLLYLMKTQSQDKIEATPDPDAIDLASDRIFSVKPPFIFFTGHRDFVLTQKEVDNLQRYVRLGGAIWGDSSLPGQRSRFDIAFRREMKRVIPDIDKQFEALPASHDIFTKTYYNDIRAVPPGINSYQEPVYALKYNGEVAILYTANDYGDMWQIGLNDHWDVDFRKDANDNLIAINKDMWDNRNNYFRGIDAVQVDKSWKSEKVANSFKFGTNIVIHLLTRWEDKVRSVGQL